MKIEIPKKKNLKFIEKFFENKNLGYLIKLSKRSLNMALLPNVSANYFYSQDLINGQE